MHVWYRQYKKGEMIMIRIAVSEARDKLSDIMNRIAYSGERIVIHRREKDMVAFISIEDLSLLEKIEDLLDNRAMDAALKESSEEIPQEEVWKSLGLE
jgi:PHD/YefM family antitoxin component YafN of YafNO toxin-antitoxin module